MSPKGGRRWGSLVAAVTFALAGMAGMAGCEDPVREGRIEVLARMPHDPEAYTQGLVFHDGVLYESTGRYGSSTLRRVDPASGAVLERVALDDRYFGEGLAKVGDELVQLTWKERAALVWDLPSLTLKRTAELDTDGWGACYDGRVLYSTSGGSILFLRDPATLETLEHVQATVEGERLGEINEMECVGGHIYANVYQTSQIVKIDKATGRVVARFDGSALVPPTLRGDVNAVLNGIAHDPSSDTFYLTGKLWPVMYRVRLLAG